MTVDEATLTLPPTCCVCTWQTYETGLFRGQLEDGIMGLSNQDLTIIPKLKVRSKGAYKQRRYQLHFTYSPLMP